MNVTIVIPNYNSAKYLDRCICSILGQTYRDIRVVLADDCSTDNSIEIAKKYGIEVISNKKNSKSPSAGINRTAYLSDSKYFMHVDSDDILAVNTVQMFVDSIEDNDYIFGNLVCIDENDNVWSKWKYHQHGNMEIVRNVYHRSGSGIIPMFGLFRTAWLKKHKWSNLFHAEDTMTCIDYCSFGWKIKHIDYDFYYYRQRENSLSSQGQLRTMARKEIIKKCFHYLYEN